MPLTAANVWLFVLAVIFVAINGLTQLSYANGMGFKLKPTGVGFLVAAIFGAVVGTATPISGQAAMLTVSGKIINARERTAALLIASAGMTILGALGVISAVVAFAGPPVVMGMMAGVGLMLAEVAGVTMVRSNPRTAAIAIVFALLTWGFTHDLVYTLVVSVLAASIDYLFIQRRRVDMSELHGQSESGKFWTRGYWRTEDWSLIRPEFNVASLIGALSLLSLSIGITSSFGTINANISGVAPNLDGLTLMTGLADLPSIMFGGAPLSAIVAGTAGAPWPVLGAIMVMLLLGVLLLVGAVIKLCKYIAYESIAGFLVIIGIFATFIPNINNAFATGQTGQAAIAMAVTAITKNPFFGLVAGIATRYFGPFLGI